MLTSDECPRKSSLEFMQDYSDHVKFFIRQFFAHELTSSPSYFPSVSFRRNHFAFQPCFMIVYFLPQHLCPLYTQHFVLQTHTVSLNCNNKCRSHVHVDDHNCAWQRNSNRYLFALIMSSVFRQVSFNIHVRNSICHQQLTPLLLNLQYVWRMLHRTAIS